MFTTITPASSESFVLDPTDGAMLQPVTGAWYRYQKSVILGSMLAQTWATMTAQSRIGLTILSIG